MTVDALPLDAKDLPTCRLCGQRGEPLYRGLTDQLYGVAGLWDYLSCAACGIAWLNRRPYDLTGFYATYYTHRNSEPGGWMARLRRSLDRLSYVAGATKLGYVIRRKPAERIAAIVLNLLRPAREMAAMRFAGIENPAQGRVLEVGCGNGALLGALRDVGWHVAGLEFDAKAVEAARARGIDTYHGTLQDVSLQSGTFRYVILNHVIEHVPDPAADLRRCKDLLAPGGCIIILTPNLAGFGHRYFSRAWRGLEPPRHLMLFSPKSMQKLAQLVGLRVVKVSTLVRGARFIYGQSARIRAGLADIENSSNCSAFRKALYLAGGYIFQCIEWIAILFRSDQGEEIIVNLAASAQSEHD